MLQSASGAVSTVSNEGINQRARLTAPEGPAAIYAIGDVHGCLGLLQRLEADIYADGTAFAGEKWIVMLGDYVDRGPDSAGVLDHLRAAPPQGYRRICLAGNHEIMMLAFIDQPVLTADWLRFGGKETLQSYGIDASAWAAATTDAGRRELLRRRISSEHLEFMRALPLCLQVGRYVFVHAGLRHGVPLEQQSERDLLWLRPGEDIPFQDGLTVVHGHTPVARPHISPWRIDLDTGAVFKGVLTAARLTQYDSPVILQVGS